MELNKALSIADEIVQSLSPHCELINIAGSCRREKPEVKDIEIVCTPKPKLIMDVFGEEMKEGRVKGFVKQVQGLGETLKGSAPDGLYTVIKLKEGIKLDLFIPADNDYYRIFALRTGSLEYSRDVIARGWNKIGWCGVDGELRKIKDCIKVGKKWKCLNPSPELPPVWTSEQDFFDWIKVRWVAPSSRI